MRSILLEEFARNILLFPDDKLRKERSKHQKKIKELQDLIKELGECGSLDVAQKLVEVEPINCRGITEYVAHLRYLQYCVNYLRENIHNYEGQEDLVVSKG
ncbi:hypothetical protein ES702_00563 [subsurface metagenome]